MLAAPRKRRRLTNAHKLSVFKQLFEGSDEEDLQKIERLLERLSGIDKRIEVVRQEITDPHILEMQVDDLRVQIDHLRIRVTYLRRGIKKRNVRRLELKMSYLKDKAIKQGLESLSISLDITCARFRKVSRELAFTKTVGQVGFVSRPIYENIRDTVKEARIGILECGRAPTKQLSGMGDWEDEMHQQLQRRRRLILEDDDASSDEEKTQGAKSSDLEMHQQRRRRLILLVDDDSEILDVEEKSQEYAPDDE